MRTAKNAAFQKRNYSKLITRELLLSIRRGMLAVGDQTMLMLHKEAFGAMRQELILMLGSRAAEDLLTRIGYVAGTRAAAVARQLLPKASILEQLLFGAALHGLEGFVDLEHGHMHVDAENGKYECEHQWTRSTEAELHLATHGLSRHPVCWLQTGYASGFASACFGRPLVYRELECRGRGDLTCRLVGELAESSTHGDESNRRFLRPHSFVNRHFEKGHTPPTNREGIVGASGGLFAACDQIDRVAKTDANVLFLGETGVGKERFAKMLHEISPRAAGPFVAVNCATLPQELVEAELFGTESGAFTGAKKRDGRFQRAEGGTLFLDEISTLPIAAQAKLLRALQEREIEPVGSSRPVRVNFRLACATNIDLSKAIAGGRFREDLYYRIAVVPVVIPPLRRRPEDIPLLLRHFLDLFMDRYKKCRLEVSDRALRALMAYKFPGNVRELENMVERAVIMAPANSMLDTPQFFSDVAGFIGDSLEITGGKTDADATRGEDLNSFAAVRSFELDLVSDSLQAANGNIAAAARRVGMTRSQFVYRMKRIPKSDVN